MEDSGDSIGQHFDDFDVAIAHWHVNAWGGAEYLVSKLAEALDEDIVYTLGRPDPDGQNPYGDISFEDITPKLDYSNIRRFQRQAGRVFEYAQWEDVDWRKLGNPDVLVTSGSTTRAVITPDDTLHINYCHSPPRWFYDLYHDRKNSWTGVLSRPLMRYLRTRDMSIDTRVDYYLVNSPIIKRRLWKFYKRESEILYPPVDLNDYYTDADQEFFLHLGRLDKEKGVPAIIEGFAGLDHDLVLAGGRGDVEESLMNTIESAKNIEWKGFVDESEKYELIAKSSAVVFNGHNEDFGIVPIEANASGKPVLSRNDGFPGVFVEEQENGVLHDGTPSGIRKSVETFAQTDFDPAAIQKKVQRFSMEKFRDQLRSQIKSKKRELDDKTSF